jgi:hypothetical protein
MAEPEEEIIDMCGDSEDEKDDEGAGKSSTVILRDFDCNSGAIWGSGRPMAQFFFVPWGLGDPPIFFPMQNCLG